MKLERRKRLILTFTLAVLPGFLLLTYASTLVQCGITATDWRWTSSPSYYHSAVLRVNITQPMSSLTVSGQRLVISSLSTGGDVVSILVASEMNGTLLNYDSVSGDSLPGITFPAGQATGWVANQEYSISVVYEGAAASVQFDYHTEFLIHTDRTVCRTLPGYDEALVLGFVLLGSGAVGFLAYCILNRQGQP